MELKQSTKAAALLLALLTASSALTACQRVEAKQTPEPTPYDASQPAGAALPDASDEAPAQLPEPEAAEPPLQYDAYVQGHDGFFEPEKACSRAELAQILKNLGAGAEPAQDAPAFPDVVGTSWYAPAVAALSGVLHGYPDGTFRPAASVTLAQLLAILGRMAQPELEDGAEIWYTPYLEYAGAQGWLDGLPDCDPARPAARATVVAVCNRAFGITPDKTAIDAIGRPVFLDVSPETPGYYDILAAAVSHGADWSADSLVLPTLAPGLHRSGSLAYYVREDGTLYDVPGLLEVGGARYLIEDASGRIATDGALHLYDGSPVFCTETGALLQNAGWHDFYFDETGTYTSRDASIDAAVEEILASCTTPEMTQEEKLRACYNYVRDYRYLGRNATIYTKTMPRENAVTYANKIYTTGKGDCYNFAAAFYFLAKRLGYDATAIIGTCGYVWNTHAIAHAWVEIPMDGTVYLFDPQIENYNTRYGISNETHSAFKVTYDTAPARYYKN